jgi:hypothetical protein
VYSLGSHHAKRLQQNRDGPKESCMFCLRRLKNNTQCDIYAQQPPVGHTTKLKTRPQSHYAIQDHQQTGGNTNSAISSPKKCLNYNQRSPLTLPDPIPSCAVLSAVLSLYHTTVEQPPGQCCHSLVSRWV